MERERDVNKSGTPGIVLPRAHPNAGTDGDVAENALWNRMASRVSRRSGTHPRLGPPNFIYEIETL
jgi:hypothetical protein